MSYVVDAHFHVWSTKTHPWLKNVVGGGHIAGDFAPIIEYSIDDYIKDARPAGVAKAVHVETVIDPLEETRFLSELPSKNELGFPQGIVAHCDLHADDAARILEAQSKYERVRGIRQLLDYHPTCKELRQAPHDKFLDDPAWLKGLALLEKYNFSFDMHVTYNQMERASRVIGNHPNIQFIIDHNGLPYDKDEETVKAWQEGLKKISQNSNVAIKLSGYAMLDRYWTAESTKPLIEFTVTTFGADRCMFASNYPVDKINSTYQGCLDALKANIARFSDAEQTNILAKTAERVYRI
ncbi:uncharacterized protein y4mH-like [Oscarella lobularis]|uniref:uncharacterized protein y4mH-like n=1 Tax=Oscarella lobularis TaxID=121494 RepID=UPI003314364F